MELASTCNRRFRLFRPGRTYACSRSCHNLQWGGNHPSVHDGKPLDELDKLKPSFTVSFGLLRMHKGETCDKQRLVMQSRRSVKLNTAPGLVVNLVF